MALSLQNFNAISATPLQRVVHTTRSREKDLHRVIKELVESKVFGIIPERKHKSFGNMKTNLISTLSEADFKKWMIDHYTTVLDQNSNV